MSRQTFIFVGVQAQDPDLMHLIEHGHEFDDDAAWAGGPDIPLSSGYSAMVEIRDTDGDQQRQQAIAGQSSMP